LPTNRRGRETQPFEPISLSRPQKRLLQRGARFAVVARFAKASASVKGLLAG
jgi:hypothetical protein